MIGVTVARAAARPRIMPDAWAGRLVAMVIHRAHDHDTTAGAAVAGAALERDFDALFARCEARIFGYLWRVTGDRHVASDLCQETFLRAWQHFAKVSGYEQPEAWLWRVATNLALNHRRARAIHAADVALLDADRDPAASASDPAWRVAVRASVHATLLALPPKPRAALVLREVYGLSFAEVAAALACTPAAAKMTLSRARERFRRLYTAEHSAEEGRP
ncbi:MAG TPA: sigma-70 family RNA polymerase sigma factor [Ktedonobacterales bacterium]|jgi:RNA polymerase sigma factor (sigma-70 family)|nr:sigma-70 family RNA polymerase sigma factor [Ktedonobacterales bacterium]